MSVFLLILEIIFIGGLLVGFYQKNTNLFCKSKKRYDGRTVLVTGGTAGMGLEIATDFAHRGARVLIACPFHHEGQRAKNIIERSSGSDKIVFKLLDLASLKSIRKFAADILEHEERLDVLVNNAGIGPTGDFITADGMNFVMQVNFYGPFLLTMLLLPLLRKTGRPAEPSRIVNTASVLHRIGTVDFENINKTNYWYKMQLYANSKLWLVMLTRQLARKIKESHSHTVVNLVDPGAVGTGIFQSGGKYFGNFTTFIFGKLFKNPWEGAQTALYVATSDRAGKMNGEYFMNCALSRATEKAYHDALGQRVWDEAMKLVALSDDEYKKCFEPLAL